MSSVLVIAPGKQAVIKDIVGTCMGDRLLEPDPLQFVYVTER